MTEIMRKTPRAARWVAVALVIVLVVALVYLLTGGGTKTGTAYLKFANSIYPGDSIKILGMDVGKIDKLTPEGDKVRVDFHYDGKYNLPADVKAAVLSPTLVATRFIQLDPAYTAGPVFPDGGVIPVERTHIPTEFDELKKQLDQFSESFGPNGVNKDGAINRALDVINKNGVQDGVGQGKAFRDMIVELSKATRTLSDSRGDLFGTVDNLARFSSVLNQFDTQIVQFQQRLGDVSATLNSNSDELKQLLPRVEDAGNQVDKFFRDHSGQLTETVDRAGSINRAIAQIRDDFAQALHIGPNGLTNFANLIHPRTGVLYGAVTIGGYTNSLLSPGNQVCALITSAAAANELTAQRMCAQQLGPLFAQLLKLGINKPIPTIPLVPGLVVPQGSTPSYGDLNAPDKAPDTNPSPNGSNSDLPRSTTSDRTDKSYSDNGFPVPGLPAQNPVIPGGR